MSERLPSLAHGGGTAPAPSHAPPCYEISSVPFASSHMLTALREPNINTVLHSPKFPSPPIPGSLPSPQPHPPPLGAAGVGEGVPAVGNVLRDPQQPAVQISHTHTHSHHPAAISMQPEMRPRDYRGRNKERAEHICTESLRSRWHCTHTHTHTRQMMGGLAAIWDKSWDFCPCSTSERVRVLELPMGGSEPALLAGTAGLRGWESPSQ